MSVADEAVLSGIRIVSPVGQHDVTVAALKLLALGEAEREFLLLLQKEALSVLL